MNKKVSKIYLLDSNPFQLILSFRKLNLFLYNDFGHENWLKCPHSPYKLTHDTRKPISAIYVAKQKCTK